MEMLVVWDVCIEQEVAISIELFRQFIADTSDTMLPSCAPKSHLLTIHYVWDTIKAC